MRKKWKIAVFASGSGSNAERMVEHFNKTVEKRVVLILTNNPRAFVLERARRLGVPSVVFDRNELRSGRVLQILREHDIDVVVLAGFLWLVPEAIIRAYRGRIVNIHPALLPRYGGKGMYGLHVHRAVIGNGEKESGITIHQVNEEYDKGDILFQARCPVLPGDTPEALQERVHALEYEHYPRVVEELIDSLDREEQDRLS